MTEQEIIRILKDNYNKGVAFNFLPKEVKNWVKHVYQGEKGYLFYNNDGWEPLLKSTGTIEKYTVICLEDSFEPKKDISAWISFDIDENGYFTIHTLANEFSYNWFDYDRFLKDSRKYGWNFTHFGGWEYKEHTDFWYTSQQILTDEKKGCISNVCDGRFSDNKPLTPVKIRFWSQF